MGKSINLKYRIEIKKAVGGINNIGWSVKDFGTPNFENLDTFITDMNKSFRPGGVNFWAKAKQTPRIIEAQLINQRSGEVVAHYDASAVFVASF